MTTRIFRKPALHFFLNLHSKSYAWASALSCRVEGSQHPKHRITDYHQWFLDNIESDKSILDVGCGNGSLSETLKKKTNDISAVEIDERNAELAKERNPELTVYHNDFLKFAPKREKFDFVVMSNVLEHIDDRVGALKSAARLGKKVLIRVPMIDRDWITPYKRERELEWRLDLTHYTEYTEDEIKDELKTARLRILSQRVRWGEFYCVAEPC